MLTRWRPVLRYLPPYRGAIAVGLVALVVAILLQIGAPLVFRESLTAIEKPLERGDAIDFDRVALFAALAVLATVVGGFAAFWKRYQLIRVSRRVEVDLRHELFAHIQRLPRSYFDQIRTGDLMSRATEDLNAARMAIGPAFMYLLDSVFRVGLAIPAMLSLNVELTLISLVPLSGIFLGLFYFAPRIHTAARAVQDQLGAISARAQESFAGSRVVKTFATEPREQRTMEELSSEYLARNVRHAKIRGSLIAWLALLGGGGFVVVVWMGGRAVMSGEFDVSSLIIFLVYPMMLIWPMMAFGWILSLVQRGAAGLDRIGVVLAEAGEDDPRGAFGAAKGALEVKDLRFAYNGRPVLDGISFRLDAGSTLGIVGATGSGKSTLVSLLPRLYDPPAGTVFLDGRDVREIPLDDLRGAIAFVPQEAFLFSTSIRANVAFGRRGTTDAVVEDAVRDARLEPDLEVIPGGIEAVVGERGVTLSGGQKQRTALARALATDAPILVLDDALSAVDTETEAAILENLRRIGRDRTVLIVAHRVSAVRDADLILVLDEGRVKESGTHDELVAQGGDYAALARAQELEDEIEGIA